MTLTEVGLISAVIGGYAYLFWKEIKPTDTDCIWKPKKHYQIFSNEFKVTEAGEIWSRVYNSGTWKKVFSESPQHATEWLLKKYPKARIVD